MEKREVNEELIRIIISAVLFGISYFFKEESIIKILLIILSYVIVAYEMFINSIKSIKEGEIFDENFLMIVATIVAFCIKAYSEAVTVMLLFQIGEYLSDLAVSRTKKNITSLMDFRSDKVNLKINSDYEEVDIKSVKLGDIFVVKPGEKVPLDGVIIDGESTLDTSKITGESVPRKYHIDDTVLSGFINKDSLITVKATSVFETSTASKIIDIIENSNEKKTKTEKFITRFAKIYTPIVILCAVLLTVIPTMLGKDFSTQLYNSLVFIVTSCPCALVISVPLGFFCGIGRASKEGILVKGSNELEHLTEIKAVVLDKTGTITKGTFEVTNIVSKNISKDELLKLAAYAENFSTHPIAKSVLKAYGKNIKTEKIKDFKEIPGKGVEVTYENKKIIVGNAKLLEKNNVEFDEKDSIGAVIYVAQDSKYIGSITISDVIKDEAYTLVDNLYKAGVPNVIMLSGDNVEIVSKVGEKVNINNFHANLLPQEKVTKLQEIKEESFTAFVGDGINDAPVIKLSDIGIAMGGIGSDAAIEAADIVLMRDDLNKIPESIKISKLTKNVVKFNIGFIIIAKIIVLLAGALGYSTIWGAVFADVGVTLIAVLNTLIITFKKIK